MAGKLIFKLAVFRKITYPPYIYELDGLEGRLFNVKSLQQEAFCLCLLVYTYNVRIYGYGESLQF